MTSAIMRHASCHTICIIHATRRLVSLKYVEKSLQRFKWTKLHFKPQSKTWHRMGMVIRWCYHVHAHSTSSTKMRDAIYTSFLHSFSLQFRGFALCRCVVRNSILSLALQTKDHLGFLGSILWPWRDTSGNSLRQWLTSSNLFITTLEDIQTANP